MTRSIFLVLKILKMINDFVNESISSKKLLSTILVIVHIHLSSFRSNITRKKGGLHYANLNNFCILEAVIVFLTHVLKAILFCLFRIVLDILLPK